VTTLIDLKTTALIVVDVQTGFDEPGWGPRNNPGCEANVAALISAWRHRQAPMVFVRHDSRIPGSPLAPSAPGNRFKHVVSGEPDLLVTKHVHSAFSGSPSLDAWLRSRALSDVAVCGITTNHCCDTTARTASDLGYQVLFVLDATHAFDQLGPDGVVTPAEDVYRMTGASLATRAKQMPASFGVQGPGERPMASGSIPMT